MLLTLLQNTKCEACQKLYCQRCIDLHLKKNKKSCPHCAGVWKPQRLSPFELETLDSIKFQCHVCTKSIFYSERIKHASQTCPGLTLNCPAGCGEANFQTEEDLRNHLAQKCSKIVRTCNCQVLDKPKYVLQTDDDEYCTHKMVDILHMCQQETNDKIQQFKDHLTMCKGIFTESELYSIKQSSNSEESSQQMEEEVKVANVSVLDLMTGLDELIQENMSEQAYRTFREHGQIDFGDPPEDLDKEIQRTFSRWKMGKNGNFWQGEKDQDGQRDGRGVGVAPGKGVEVGYHKNNKKHGMMLKIMQTGKKEIKMYQEGLRHGQSIKFKPDGTSKTYLYENDVLVGDKAKTD